MVDPPALEFPAVGFFSSGKGWFCQGARIQTDGIIEEGSLEINIVNPILSIEGGYISPLVPYPIIDWIPNLVYIGRSAWKGPRLLRARIRLDWLARIQFKLLISESVVN